MFEPDITIVCDPTKLDDCGCKGSPDLVMEIILSSTARKDKIEKFNKYEQAGVKEFWLVEPQEKIVSVFMLQDNHRFGRPELFTDEDQVTISIFKGLTIDLKMVFSE